MYGAEQFPVIVEDLSERLSPAGAGALCSGRGIGELKNVGLTAHPLIPCNDYCTATFQVHAPHQHGRDDDECADYNSSVHKRKFKVSSDR